MSYDFYPYGRDCDLRIDDPVPPKDFQYLKTVLWLNEDEKGCYFKFNAFDSEGRFCAARKLEDWLGYAVANALGDECDDDIACALNRLIEAARKLIPQPDENKPR